MAGGKGTNPIHNKKPKKKEEEKDDFDLANAEKRKNDAKVLKEAQAMAKSGKGPLNMGQQGIKKSGKK